MESRLGLYPLVFVDIALFTIEDNALRVLLVRRAEPPLADSWALPGGLLKPEVDSGLEEAARRVLRDKVTVDIPHLKEVRTFSGSDRDPRGWSVAVLFYALLPRNRIDALVRSKVDAVRWAEPVAERRQLAFDHGLQLEAAVHELRSKVGRGDLPLHLMPPHFTLTDLQRTCEAILGRPLDKGVFRRRHRGSRDLVETDDYVRGPQRPARLYAASPEFVF
jgi:ADP-ribose pyrophosphatase YjhB (NUDIX family)